MEDFLNQLRRVNAQRWESWSEGRGEDPLFQSNEFGGEAGEVMNVVKKLEREARGWRGSRDTVEHLGDEIADAIICLDSLARAYKIDLKEAVIRKFNATSEKNDFPHRLTSEGSENPMVMLEDHFFADKAPRVPFYELEQPIMDCWNVTEDLNTLFAHVVDTVVGQLDNDQIANALLGLKTIYEMKFQQLFNKFEELLKRQAGR